MQEHQVLVVQPYLPLMDGFVAAWLPGSEGEGVADVLFGDYGFKGKLCRTWFKTVEQLPMNFWGHHYDSSSPLALELTNLTEPRWLRDRGMNRTAYWLSKRMY